MRTDKRLESAQTTVAHYGKEVARMMFWVEIKGEIDSRKLWELIKSYKVNLTEVIEKTWVHGEAPVSSVGEIISLCAQFGDLEAKVYEGGAKNEQTQKEEGKTSPDGIR